LFLNGSIRENFDGKPNATDVELWARGDASKKQRELQRLPAGLEVWSVSAAEVERGEVSGCRSHDC
jgi:hypothetical protein